MRPRKYAVLGLAFLLCLAFDAWLYGSLARKPGVGPDVAAAARAHAPLLHAYIVLGRPWVAHAGATGAQHVADAAFGDAYPQIAAMPEVADSLLFSQSRGRLSELMTLLFWAAPVLLVLTILAWAFRGRPVHLVGRARR